MNSVRRKRKQLWKSVLTFLTLGSTLPVLALLCRGHSPSRFDVANLPAWERTTPSAPRPLGGIVDMPLPASSVKFASLPLSETLLYADENRMFSTLEISHGLPGNRLDAGKPGVWLEQAAVLSRWDPALLPKMDRVAKRLMNAEDNNGYLGAMSPTHAYTAHDIAAHSNNLRGLLAYYDVTRQPAAMYAAIRAGDFLLDSYDPWPGHEEPGAEDALVYALTRLYSDSGGAEFLRFAQREEATRGSDGLGLCALYEATGDRRYLTQAEIAWNRSTSSKSEHSGPVSPGPQFSAEIFKLTGDPKYLAGLHSTDSVWPMTVAFTRTASGLNVNCLMPASVYIGSARLKFSTYLRLPAGENQTGAKSESKIQPRPNAAIKPARQQSGTIVADIVAQTISHAPSTVHVTLEPGCISAKPNQTVLIAVNGKRVAYRQSTGLRFALRSIATLKAALASPKAKKSGMPIGATNAARASRPSVS